MMVRIRYPEKLVYPESDGLPMGENSLQIKWIVALYNGLDAVFRNRADVLVTADLFWYPVKGDPTYTTAPDIMVVFGRPKGDRSSYKQWEEGNIAPQVVFEIVSPSNTSDDRDTKLEFYRENGVEEFYEYDPRFHELDIRVRQGKQLVRLEDVDEFTSPRLGVRFELPIGEPMRVFAPDGKPFRSYLELVDDLETERRRTEAERFRAEAERRRAETLAAKLRELGVDPDRV